MSFEFGCFNVLFCLYFVIWIILLVRFLEGFGVLVIGVLLRKVGMVVDYLVGFFSFVLFFGSDV